jgi:hypothetical protein
MVQHKKRRESETEGLIDKNKKAPQDADLQKFKERTVSSQIHIQLVGRGRPTRGLAHAGNVLNEVVYMRVRGRLLSPAGLHKRAIGGGSPSMCLSLTKEPEKR